MSVEFPLHAFSRKLALLVAVSVFPATAANISYEGSFLQDDNLQFFTFTVGSTSTVTFLTHSYGGGVNAAGSTIARGGFDPILSLFAGNLQPDGALLGANNDGTCGPLQQDAVTNACWDSLFTLELTTGVYTLVLSQSDNSAFGPTFGDGFSRDGQGNFTGPAFIGQPGSFWDQNPNQRDGHWAVDILNVDSPVVVPEPSSALLIAGGLLSSALYSRRRARRRS